MRTLHALPRFEDRWSHLYLERGNLDQDGDGLWFRSAGSATPLPIDQLGLVMLGPGTTLTHAAVKALARNNCLVAWVGEDGVRLYAHSTGGTFSARRLLHQVRLYADEAQRLAVIQRMYQKRFPGADLSGKTLEQIRGMEGLRVRATYEATAKEFGLPWDGRAYDQGDWSAASPANRAVSCANACLYGVCHAAIVSAGWSAAIGFIHTGKMLSFVYDVADLYKTEVTIPTAFRVAAKATTTLERDVRMACREAFHQHKLLRRILPDIKEVLHVGDDFAETAQEHEGRAESLADGGQPGGLPGESQLPGA
jgi:CRISPR-associated protein Cas1